MSKNLAFIPVRGGSKSIPKKNIKLFCGKPLVYWVCKSAQESSIIDEIIVATDSHEIKKIVLSFGFSKTKIFERSSLNAKDNSTTESVMIEYIKNKDPDPENHIFLIQATSPFLQSDHLTEGFKQLINSNADSLLSCSLVKRFIWDWEGESINYDYKNRPRRQDFKGTLVENGAFYINTIKNVIDTGNRLSGNISTYQMPEYSLTEIDEPDDWFYAEYLMRKYILNKEIKSEIKLFLSDVDGVLTDAGMYYSENGDELKKFNTRDGMAFQLLKKAGIYTGLITSEETNIVIRRAKKISVDFLHQGKEKKGKLEAAVKICKDVGIELNHVAYIGDDINCFELLSNVGIAACPNDASESIKSIPGIIKLRRNGGDGAVREFAEYLLGLR